MREWVSLLLFLTLTLPSSAQNEIVVHIVPEREPPTLSPEIEDSFMEASTFGARYFVSGDLQSSLEQYGKAQTILPNHPAVLHNLALVLLRMGRHAEAQEMIDVYRALYPDGRERDQVRALQIHMNWVRDVHKRKQQSQSYIELFNRGKFVFESGRHSEALDMFKQAEAQRTDDPAAVYNQAVALEALGDYVAATERLRHFLSLHQGGDGRAAVDQKLFELQTEIGDQQRSIVCAFCGARLSKESAWCPHCWRGPYLPNAAQWNTRSCVNGQVPSIRSLYYMSGKLAKNEDLTCFHEGSLAAALKYSRSRQRAIQEQRKKEGWLYEGDLITGFRDGNAVVDLTHQDGQMTRAVSRENGEFLEYDGREAAPGVWLLEAEERVIEGQKYSKRYEYDEQNRLKAEIVRYHAANRCGHVVEVTAKYVYEGDRLMRVDLASAYRGYKYEGFPESAWSGKVTFVYDASGAVEREELNITSHTKTHTAKIPGRMRDQLDLYYPGLRAKAPLNLLGKSDVCDMVGGRWVSDAIDLRAFDSWSPNLDMVVPTQITRVVVGHTLP